MEAFNLSNPIHRLDVEQFHRMIDAGVFVDGDRVELVDGELRDMTPIGPPHGGDTDYLTKVFVTELVDQAIVRVQGALVIDQGTELYPDLTVLEPRADWYRTTNPTGDDALLVIEVADSSLNTDLTTKLAKYARAGVRRYWVVDIPHRRLHDYRDPDRFGRRYRQLHTIDSGTVAVSIAGIDIELAVGDLFP